MERANESRSRRYRHEKDKRKVTSVGAVCTLLMTSPESGLTRRHVAPSRLRAGSLNPTCAPPYHPGCPTYPPPNHRHGRSATCTSATAPSLATAAAPTPSAGTKVTSSHSPFLPPTGTAITTAPPPHVQVTPPPGAGAAVTPPATPAPTSAAAPTAAPPRTNVATPPPSMCSPTPPAVNAGAGAGVGGVGGGGAAAACASGAMAAAAHRRGRRGWHAGRADVGRSARRRGQWSVRPSQRTQWAGKGGRKPACMGVGAGGGGRHAAPVDSGSSGSEDPRDRPARRSHARDRRAPRVLGHPRCRRFQLPAVGRADGAIAGRSVAGARHISAAVYLTQLVLLALF